MPRPTSGSPPRSGIRLASDPIVAYEDDDVVVVDKAAGVPTQASDPRIPDDLPSRLRRFLAERSGRAERDVYLGIHQRLDAATSGVVLYTKRREVNAAVARELEGRHADKRYVAVVTGWRRGASARLEHRLAERSGGRVEVVPARDRRGREAVTHVRVLEKHGDRALVEARIETGRTHQIRVQLAAAGAPVAGDGLYGGVPAPRLMLHARSIELAHPSGGRLAVETAIPDELREFARGEPSDPFEPTTLSRRLDRACELRAAFAWSSTSAFRLVNEAGDALPGLAVDVYGDYAVAQLYDDAARSAEPVVLDALAALGFDGVYVKRRPKQANVVVDTRREELAPAHALRGRDAPSELVVREDDTPFVVRLGDGLSTGLFLDQRENRRRVRELASGARVLNLFAYTCGFSVAAAVGGARRTVSVDASSSALAWGRRNFEAASITLAGDAHRFVDADVFDVLAQLARGRERFDLVVLDPPTFSTTRSTTWASGTQYRELAALCVGVTAPGGRLLACSNDRRMVRAKFRRYLHEAARDAKRNVKQMKDLPSPRDFPVAAGAEPHTKSVLVTLS